MNESSRPSIILAVVVLCLVGWPVAASARDENPQLSAPPTSAPSSSRPADYAQEFTQVEAKLNALPANAPERPALAARKLELRRLVQVPVQDQIDAIGTDKARIEQEIERVKKDIESASAEYNAHKATHNSYQQANLANEARGNPLGGASIVNVQGAQAAASKVAASEKKLEGFNRRLEGLTKVLDNLNNQEQQAGARGTPVATASSDGTADATGGSPTAAEIADQRRQMLARVDTKIGALQTTTKDQERPRGGSRFARSGDRSATEISRLRAERDRIAKLPNSEIAALIVSERETQAKDAVLRSEQEKTATAAREAALKGDKDAMLVLGEALVYGRGMKKNEAEGIDWLRKADEGGHPDAAITLARYYYNTQYLPGAVEQALIWYKKAAARGNEDAQNRIEELTRRASAPPAQQTQERSNNGKPCTTCQGKGLIHNFRRGGGTLAPDYDRWETCWTCQGTGRVQ